MFETGEPHTRVELVAALGRVQQEGNAYLRTLPPSVFFAPQGPAWSPDEHARHLVKSMSPLMWVLRLPRPVLGLLFGRHREPGSGRTVINAPQCALRFTTAGWSKLQVNGTAGY
jgi:hypothetical protein